VPHFVEFFSFFNDEVKKHHAVRFGEADFISRSADIARSAMAAAKIFDFRTC
jgi:hypothetical protein